MKFKPWMIIAAAVIAIVAIVAIIVFVFGWNPFAKKAATVNGDVIYYSEVQNQLDRVSSQYKTADQKKAFEQQKKQIEKQI
ncbi:MAG: SurA N-terminal domain-containing protein, partial [Actinomycetota bacterium]